MNLNYISSLFALWGIPNANDQNHVLKDQGRDRSNLTVVKVIKGYWRALACALNPDSVSSQRFDVARAGNKEPC